jgi:hypothetical protein
MIDQLDLATTHEVPEIIKQYGGSNVKISRVPELENSKVIGDII